MLHIGAVDLDRSGVGIVKARNQVDDRGLAPACRPHQRRHLPRFHLHADLLEHRIIRLVTETDLAQFDLAVEHGRAPRARQVPYLPVRIQHLANPLVAHGGFRVRVGHLR